MIGISKGQTLAHHSLDEFSLNLAWSPDDQRLCSAGLYDQIDIWEPQRQTGDIQLGNFSGFRWSRNGARLVAWQQGEITVWETSTWTEIQSTQLAGSIQDAIFDHSTDRLIVALENGPICHWSVSGNQIISHHPVACQSIDMHPTKYLIACGNKNAVVILDFNGTQVAKTMVGAEWAEYANHIRWHSSGDGLAIHSTTTGAMAWLGFSENGLARTGVGNAGMSSNGTTGYAQQQQYSNHRHARNLGGNRAGATSAGRKEHYQILLFCGTSSAPSCAATRLAARHSPSYLGNGTISSSC